MPKVRGTKESRTTSSSTFSNDGAPDLEALLRGDPVAFEQLVRRESMRLFRVIQRIVSDENEAESILQETFLQAFKRLDTFRRESKITTWIYAIGINLARASLRKSRRYDTMAEEDLDRLQPSFSNGTYSDQHSEWNPQKIAEIAERKELIHAAIEKLPPDYRMVVLLRDIEELSTTEVAQILSISDGAVRVRLHRARQALRKLLDRHFQS